MAVSRSGVDNSKIQDMINQKFASGPVDESGNKLSKSAIQAEFARAFLKAGKKQDEIDFLVYGIDKS
jgi:hypothetical protein